MGNEDGYFKRPGAVPFKWEEKPGVPKASLISLHHEYDDPSPPSSFCDDHHRSLPSTPQRLGSPPFESYFIPLPILRVRSTRSFTWTRSSERQRSKRRGLARPIAVLTNRLLSPMFRRKWTKKKSGEMDNPGPDPEPKVEQGYTSNVGTLARWSGSARKTLSALSVSPSSFSLRRSR